MAHAIRGRNLDKLRDELTIKAVRDGCSQTHVYLTPIYLELTNCTGFTHLHPECELSTWCHTFGHYVPDDGYAPNAVATHLFAG